eukprot:jgi/Antlo1/594/2339
MHCIQSALSFPYLLLINFAFFVCCELYKRRPFRNMPAVTHSMQERIRRYVQAASSACKRPDTTDGVQHECKAQCVRASVEALERATGGSERRKQAEREPRWCVGREGYGQYLAWLHSEGEREVRMGIAAQRMAVVAQLVCVLRGRATDTYVRPSAVRNVASAGKASACPMQVRMWVSRDCGC